MRTLSLWLSLALALVALPAHALDVPPLKAHVNDTAGLLSPGQVNTLEQKLSAYEQSTGQQFALLTVPSMEGDALESFSIRVVDAWKLGKKGKDDGLLLLIAVNDKKMRIEVGYGLEGDITDAFSSQIIRDVLQPAFRAQAFGPGIEQAFDQLMAKASGKAPPQATQPVTRTERRSNGKLRLFPILLVVVFVLLFGGGGGRGGRRRRVMPMFLPMGGGGMFGGGGGGGGWGGGGGGRFGGGGASGGW